MPSLNSTTLKFNSRPNRSPDSFRKVRNWASWSEHIDGLNFDNHAVSDNQVGAVGGVNGLAVEKYWQRNLSLDRDIPLV